MTRIQYNGIKTIALRLAALYQQLERIVDEQEITDDNLVYGYVLELMVDSDDLHALIGHLNETVHNVAKHLGIDGHATHDS